MNSDPAPDPTDIRLGRFVLDPRRRVLLDDGVPVRIGSRAIDLLLLLVRHRGRVIGKNELLDQVWPGLVVEENNLQQHISSLRKLLGPQAIVTVPGRGYQFTLLPGAAPPSGVPRDPAGVAAGPDPVQAPPVPVPGPLFGRDADLAEARARIAAHTLVTLVGPGGVGKTRLAWALVQAEAGRWRDGVWVLDLTPLERGEQLPGALARQLGIAMPADAPDADALAAVLRQQRLLLLLDNCEHLIEAVAGLVQAMRRRAPDVHVLATSQEPLRLTDEQVIRLAPLDEAAAVQLFLNRAMAAERRFVPEAVQRDAVAAICRRLDGLPLAIELAAARVPLLGVQGLREGLDASLRVLGSGPARAPARQQTLRATLAWSHTLLDGEQQRVFRRLAVFSGGFSPALAQQVLADDTLEPWAVLDHLGALVDKSLVITEGGPDGALRCRLLEAARAYALEQLEAAGEQAALRRRHAQAMADRVLALDRDMAHEPHYDRLMAPLLAEVDNVRAAMGWVAAAGAGDGPEAAALRRMALKLAAHGDWLWAEAESHGEGFRFSSLARDWLDDTVPLALACRLRLTWQAFARARAVPASTWGAELRLAVDGFRALDDRVGLYRALCQLGRAPRSVIGQAEAGALLDEAARLEDPAWSPRLRISLPLALELWHDLGGRPEACRDAGLRYLRLARETGSKRLEIGALGNLADDESALGRVDEALALCRQAIALASEIGRPATALHAYSNMVPALLARGELQAVEDAIREGRPLMVRTWGHATDLLVPAALLAWRRGQVPLAARLLGCAEAAYAARGSEPDPPERRMRDMLRVELQSALAAEPLAEMLRQGAVWDEDTGFARAEQGWAAAPK